MKRRIFLALLVFVLAYFLSYVWIRESRREVWEKDGNAYVIFPAEKGYLYYLYCPLGYFDGSFTGMKFHIGQHR
jgi:hypothetical protein